MKARNMIESGFDIVGYIKIGVMGVLAYFCKGFADSIKAHDKSIHEIREDIAKNYQSKNDAHIMRNEIREDIKGLRDDIGKVIDILTAGRK